MIVGCQRSGTTLLRHVLSEGQICVFEENCIPAYFYRERYHAHTWRGQGLEYDDPDTLVWDRHAKDFINGIYKSYYRKHKARRHNSWGLKAPGLNMAESVPYMARLFPEPKFVNMVRDPRDTVASMLRQQKMTGYRPESFYSDSLNSPDLVDISCDPYSYWSKLNEIILRQRESLGGRLMLVHYENWMDDPEVITKKICHFLDIDFSKEMMRQFTKNISNASGVSMSEADFKNGMYRASTSAIGRWKKGLTQEQIEKLIAHSEKTVEALGYNI